MLVLGISVCLFLGVPGLLQSSCPCCEKCATEKRDVSQEIWAIDRALQALEYQRLLYRARALWHSDQGMRLQNKKGFYLEARKAYKEAELEWDAVRMIEVRMENLRRRRAELIRRSAE